MNKHTLKYGALFISIMAMLTMLFDVGFYQDAKTLKVLNYSYFIYLLGIIVFIPIKYIVDFKDYPKLRIWINELVLWGFYNYLLVTIPFGELSNGAANYKIWLFIAITTSLVREFSGMRLNWRYKHANPAAIFIFSFALLVVAGTVMLMLPRASYSGISFIDALFTSTSAVCVTGLIVVDTGSCFTVFGQSIILVLIQLGGIGIMTFTSFFAYFFMGGVSYQNLVLVGNLTNENKIAEVIGTLKKILFFTFFVELIGVVLIYINIRYLSGYEQSETLFFSVFHAISAFCNAGFSTLADSFYDINFRFNYFLHVTIALLFIVGGLGFPVIINLFSWLKHWFINHLHPLHKHRKTIHQAHVFSLNTRLVLYTTLILLIVGTVMFFLLEYNNTLAEHKGLGKFITAFFCAATPRTAGFNTVDTSAIYIPTAMFIILLMWIGASPASTGGGIKTSTIALAILNIASLARGKQKVELNRRQIPETSIRRSFAFMFLALLIIGLVIIILLKSEPDKNATDLMFEVFSAFSTVGLSRGITGDLSVTGKYIISFTMFIGRVGALTFLSAFIRKSKGKLFQYPSESILIN
ncbi:MAG: ATPase [Bacteroidales bacterium]|nr:ATPase [Bacteroidales bacterium]MBN2820785.1 ATPase [Bacteroidales bacterium]